MVSFGNTFILGDSYSTFEDYIPEGYAPHYKKAGREETDVDKVEQTWWYQLLGETNSTLVRNCSYSGTTVCHTGYNEEDFSHISFIARLDKLIDKNYFKENIIDTIIIFGGTNDSWANSPIGELKYSDWSNEDLYYVLPAFCYLLYQISANIPNAKVFCIMNNDLKTDIQEGFKKACEKNSVSFIELYEIDKTYGHPTIKGMKQIKDQIIEYIKRL